MRVFGLGRYLYYFTGVWVDLDDRKRPKNNPKLFGWATPQGWREGLRPRQEARTLAPNSKLTPPGRDVSAEDASVLVRQIESMVLPLGRRLYPGYCERPQGPGTQQRFMTLHVLRKVLAQMQSAERGLRRLEAALDRVGPEALASILRSLRLNSLHQVDSLESLQNVVRAVEDTAGANQ